MARSVCNSEPLPGKALGADLMIWDPVRRVTPGEDVRHDNVGYTPGPGRTVTGWPETVILRGARVVADGGFHGTPGSGRWLDHAAMGASPSGAPATEVLSPASESPLPRGSARMLV